MSLLLSMARIASGCQPLGGLSSEGSAQGADKADQERSERYDLERAAENVRP